MVPDLIDRLKGTHKAEDEVIVEAVKEQINE